MPWRLIAVSCALILVYDVVIALIGRSQEAVFIWAALGSFLLYAAVAFVARRSGCPARTSVAAAMLVVLVDVTVGWPLTEAIAPDPEDVGAWLVAAVLVFELLVGAALGLMGVFAARVYGARRPA